MMTTKSPRHRDTSTLFHVLLPWLVTLQAALCAAQFSFWHALLQYSTLLHAPHVSKAPLGQPGHAQRRRSPAPDAPALEPEEAALVVAPLSAEQAESVSGCGEIAMAEASAKSLFTAHSSLSRSACSATSAVMAAASARVAPSRRSAGSWPLCRSANLAALSACASLNSSSLRPLKSRAKASLTRAPRTSASKRLNRTPRGHA